MQGSSAQNIVSHLQSTSARVPDRAALILADGSRCTFGALWERAGRVSRGLRERGLQVGDRVIIMIPMSGMLYEILLAVIRMGAVAVFADPWVSLRRLAAFCAFAEPRGFIGVPRSHFLRLLQPVLRKLPLTVTTGRALFGCPARYTVSELRGAPIDHAVHEVDDDSPGLITFTTGSSGVPKGVNRTHGFLNAQYTALRREFTYEEQDVDLTMFPVFALRNLADGITSVIPDMDFKAASRVDASRIVRQMRDHGVTTCTASPPFVDRLAAFMRDRRAERLGLRRILTGGAPVSHQQLTAWGEALPGTQIEIVYGSTEAEPVAHISAEERLEAEGGRGAWGGYCLGQPTPLLRTRVIAISREPVRLEDGWKDIELQRGEIGELVVAGDHVCRDYFRNPAAVQAIKIRDNEGCVWHRMGDTGCFDDKGRFWLVGRVHSTIFRQGLPVHAQLVEQVARQADARIARVGAIALPDSELGEKVVVVLETKEPTVVDDVRQRLAAAGMPVDDVMVSSEPLPLDPRHNAKIDYAKLKKMLKARLRR